jgi:hypothetical protein
LTPAVRSPERFFGAFLGTADTLPPPSAKISRMSIFLMKNIYELFFFHQ